MLVNNMDKQIRMFLDRTKELRKNSNCKFMHFGAVVVKDGWIVGEGWNESLDPATCCRKDVLQTKIVGRNPGLCNAIHAEQMAIAQALNAINRNESLVGATIYVSGEKPDGTEWVSKYKSFACTLCVRWIKHVGIKRIVTEHNDWDTETAYQSAFDDIVKKMKEC